MPLQLYSSIHPVAQTPADTSGTRIFPRAFQFPSLNIAQILLLYWSALIVLDRTMQDVDYIIAKTQVETENPRTCRTRRIETAPARAT